MEPASEREAWPAPDTDRVLTVERQGPLDGEQLGLIDAYWRAANYLSVGQIYLLANPLLSEALPPEHIKPRLLGHWGTTPGLNFIYAHMNRVIKARDLDAIYVIGPGHGGPGIVANAFLEGTLTEVYPEITNDVAGLRPLASAGTRAGTPADRTRKAGPEPDIRPAGVGDLSAPALSPRSRRSTSDSER
jgi:xylulose-5-phosphate/fructose-6-phosphate phosphoketolase